MNTNLVRKFVTSPSTNQAPTLRGILEELDITPFTPESVARYKHRKMAAVMEEIVQRRQVTQEINFAYWERRMLHQLRPDEAFDNAADDDFLVKFFELGLARIAVYVRWEKRPLSEAHEVPDYVKAKAAEIAGHLPNATFEVDELRSSERIYDPFLVASYGDENYYVEVWDEAEFERAHT